MIFYNLHKPDIYIICSLWTILGYLVLQYIPQPSSDNYHELILSFIWFEIIWCCLNSIVCNNIIHSVDYCVYFPQMNWIQTRYSPRFLNMNKLFRTAILLHICYLGKNAAPLFVIPKLLQPRVIIREKRVLTPLWLWGAVS